MDIEEKKRLSNPEWVKKAWENYNEYFDSLTPERQEEVTIMQEEFESYEDDNGEWRIRRFRENTR